MAASIDPWDKYLIPNWDIAQRLTGMSLNSINTTAMEVKQVTRKTI
ncbi:hypothetical protein [Cylindrospermum sp. FACHB-282]|nr:hypothetical protein [Cylindrospermum sp. FACHB-282]MBD2385770.1 hypothetical protein [Cylindrospermum sp. FACHB-282]